MNVKEALIILDQALHGKHLTTIEETVFCEAWAGKSYPEIAAISGYEANYIKNVGYKLWKLLSHVFNEEVTKSNLRSVFRRQSFAQHHATASLSGTDIISKFEPSVASPNITFKSNDEHTVSEDARALNSQPLQVILTTLEPALDTEPETDTAVQNINTQVLQLIDCLLKKISTPEIILSTTIAEPHKHPHYLRR